MIVVGVIVVQIAFLLFLYPLLVAGKREDETLRLLWEKKMHEEGKQELENQMESEREVIRTIENERKKGSAPLHFVKIGFTEETYHLVESHAKLNQLLDYFFRNGAYAPLADRQIKSNVYMDASKKIPVFRNTKSEFARRNMETWAKQWIKKKHPSFDGDVYVEEVRCYFSLAGAETETGRCMVDGEETTAMIFSKKHLEALYLQCLVSRKEVMQHTECLEGFPETSNRIYRLEDVDVLFQCLLMDNMKWEGNNLCANFNTVYLLK